MIAGHDLSQIRFVNSVEPREYSSKLSGLIKLQAKLGFQVNYLHEVYMRFPESSPVGFIVEESLKEVILIKVSFHQLPIFEFYKAPTYVY